MGKDKWMKCVLNELKPGGHMDIHVQFEFNEVGSFNTFSHRVFCSTMSCFVMSECFASKRF